MPQLVDFRSGPKWIKAAAADEMTTDTSTNDTKLTVERVSVNIILADCRVSVHRCMH